MILNQKMVVDRVAIPHNMWVWESRPSVHVHPVKAPYYEHAIVMTQHLIRGLEPQSMLPEVPGSHGWPNLVSWITGTVTRIRTRGLSLC